LFLAFGIAAAAAPRLIGGQAIANAASAILIGAVSRFAEDAVCAFIAWLSGSLGAGALRANAEDAREDAPANGGGDPLNGRAAGSAARDDAR
jgi:divalent metal cation (Fe/Co/Zn/Cd) transporter